MNNEQKIEKINKWQTSGVVHELTCGNKDCRAVLDAEIRDGEVVLVCLECKDYIQTWIPEVVFKFDVDAHKQSIDIFFKQAKGKNLMKWEKENEKIAQWIKDYASPFGITGAVVGLSGGIDSSVIACLAVKAFGKENVIGVSLPCETRHDMKTDAFELAKNLDIRFMEIPLEKAFSPLSIEISAALYPVPSKKFVSQMTNANIKARLRMTVLYAVAGENNYIVIGTGNLSELAVGYFTKFGDGGVDMEPLGNYYKTEVYNMAELMTEIPESVKTKAPSADLWDGQTDEDELGMTYAELDEILRILLHPNSTELDKLDFDRVSKVQKMIRVANHKNNLPPRYVRE